MKTRKRACRDGKRHETSDSAEGPSNQGEVLGQRRKSSASKLHKQMMTDSTSSQDCEDLKRLRTNDDELLSRTVKDSGEAGPLCDFNARNGPPNLHPSQIMCQLQRSLNVVHYQYGASLGKTSLLNRQGVLKTLVKQLNDLSLFRTANAFDRRVTALEWHPTNPGIVVAGSKGGDIILWNSLEHNMDDPFIHGKGPGGSIQAMKFWPWNYDQVLTASIDGRVTLNDFEGRNSRVLSDTFNCHEGPGGNISGLKVQPFNSQYLYTSSLDGRLTLHDLTGHTSQILLNTFTWDFWYCCVDVSASRKAVVTGDNVGNTLLLSSEGKTVWSHRLHKQKVTHAEFSPRDDRVFCTASTDRTVKVWDIRMVAGRASALHVLEHNKPVNSAYFSRTDGCRLLTTDQDCQLRVYCAPEWHLQRTIEHPHRFFQHITPIKATWHPLQDLAVVGRYPASESTIERRTIDIFDVDSGEMVSQIYDHSATGIVSLNKFSNNGDYLVSGMGVNLLLWMRSAEMELRQLDLMMGNGFDTEILGLGWDFTGRSSSLNPRRRPRPPSSRQTKPKKDSGTKMKMKVQTKTKKSK